MVRIYSFTEDTIRALDEGGRLSRPVIKAVEAFRNRCLTKRYGRLGTRRKPFFVTQGALRWFLRKRLGRKHQADIPILEQSIESRLALVQRIPHTDDFTFFLDRAATPLDLDGGDALQSLLGHQGVPIPLTPRAELDTYYEGELWLWDRNAKRAAAGRAVACSCLRGTRWSVTFRLQQEYPRRERREHYFNDLGDVTKILHKTIFEGDVSNRHGLIVIAGRTASGKSQIARGLIESYIGGLMKSSDGGRAVPHLVTFEDPIEKEFTKEGFSQVDCTQREIPRDSKGLTEALRNALRQTPSVMFAGETRDPKEWRNLLEFAGTGHLIITTTHAGSLVEAMGNILKETKSRTPAARSVVGDRLLSVVHIKSEKEHATRVLFLIPAIWHRTPIGVKALMSEGLSSLLPNTPPELNGRKRNRSRLPGSIGRYWFARELAKKTKYSNITERVKEKAIEWDLEGI